MRIDLPSAWSARIVFALAVILAAGYGEGAAAQSTVQSEDSPAANRPFKLTLGEYAYRGGGAPHGTDFNLRYTWNTTNAWIGSYHDRDFGTQNRAGIDSAIALDEEGRLTLQPSLQAASRGFAMASVNLQYGAPWFVLAGWGRTNLKPYFNLNFDPNDAVTLAAGHRSESGRVFYLMAVGDDRLGTGQRHLHAVARLPLGKGERLTLDLLRKTGNGDEGSVKAWGFSITYDFPRWFLRLAWDPKQNFGAADAIRFGTGMRF